MIKRILWIDYTKAFLIYLVVLGHASLQSSVLLNFIYSFHVPAFFVISGYLDKRKKDEEFLSTLKSSFKRIMVPYLFFNTIGLLTCWISPYMHPELYYNVDIIHSFLNAIIGIILMDDYVTSYSFLPVVPLWFLVSLFTCKMLFAVSAKIGKCEDTKCKVFLWVVLTAVLVFFYNLDVHLFSLDSTVLAFVFYLGGYWLKSLNFNFEKIKKDWALFLLISFICVCVLFFLSDVNGFVSIDGGNTGNNFGLFLVNACLGLFVIVLLSILVELKFGQVKFLQTIGQNTLTILGLHYTFLYFLKLFLKLGGISIHPMSLFASLSISVLAVAFCIPISQYLRNRIPWSVGLRKSNFSIN